VGDSAEPHGGQPRGPAETGPAALGTRPAGAPGSAPGKLAAGLLAAMLLGAGSGPAAAAPLDGLLSATPEASAPLARVELGIDRLNRAINFSTSADPAEQSATITSGGYQGGNLQAAWRAGERLWLSGGLWQRRISNAADTFNYRSWQAAGQYRFNDAAGALPALAMRLSAWGNRASETAATTPVHVPGAILNTVTVAAPRDQQLQADLLATWPLSSQLDISTLLSVGVSKLSYGALTATTTRNGCDYKLSFTGNDIFGELASPCKGTGVGVIRQFFDSSGDYGVDVAKEIAWRSRFVQAGVNAQWHSGPWTVLGGYLLHAVKRQDVDDILAKRGDPVHRHNHQFTLDASYRVHANWSPFARAQISSNLFLNDVPVTYNSSTSGSFGSRFSLFTIGLRGTF
jgi:hypothetical protein